MTVIHSKLQQIILAIILLISFRTAHAQHERDLVTSDVVVYGATPAGIAAALAAADHPEIKVLLVEPTNRIGGLVTNGLSHTDFRTLEGLNGAFLEFSKRVERHYAPLGQDTFHGTFAEPKVNLQVFEKMLAEKANITVVKRCSVAQVILSGRNIQEVEFRSAESGEPLKSRARIYIDATYEGDLMARAGVKFAVGREGKDAYGESLAPDQPDDQVQGYNFRFCMTRVPENRAPVKKPEGYRREDFLPLVSLLKDGKVKSVFGYPTGCLYKAHTPELPFGKYDINDVSRGLVRLSLPGRNKGWPNGNESERREIYQEHVRHNVGMLYFLQNDPAVPEKFQQEAREWGFCRDEFTESDHLPEQLYVREARRMVGRVVFTEHNTDYAPGDARTVLQRRAVAMGDYGPNCHGTDHTGPRIGGQHTGEFYKGVVPYQIPYEVLLPGELDNLLVPTACSSSHVGFCALRLEPIWMSLGEAAGTASGMAAQNGLSLGEIDLPELQRRLHRRGAATIYVSDVLPGSPDFEAVQWWGLQGGLHGLAPTPEKPGERGKNLHGQYYEAFPYHAVELNRPLEESLRMRWMEIAVKSGVAAAGLDRAETRGEFIRIAFGSIN